MNKKDEIVRDAVEESKDHRGRALLVILGVVALALLVLAGAMFYYAYTNTRDQAAAGTDLAQRVEEACGDPSRVTDDLEKLCARAGEVASSGESIGIGPPGPKGDRGDPGAPGEAGPPPSDAQVANAVALYCAGGRCRGSDGENATPAQVADAVSSYCNDRGQCRGPRGSEGEDGQDGATGPTGPQGPPPSQEQVEAAVATYCSTRNNCQGPAGPQGPPGEEGEQGPPGVVNVETNCDAPEGQVIDKVQSNYNAGTRTIVISCTYKEDATIPGTGGPNT